MKKVTQFKVGDKVFAKVKGYPAWPAIIVGAPATKYNVQFYGTGETGNVKSKDLFYYLSHKKTFTKSLKRKDYNDAIEEIESAITEAGGTDGNNAESADSTISSNTSVNDSVDSAKSTKRKRSMSLSERLVETQAKKKTTSANTTQLDSTTSSLNDSEVEENIRTAHTTRNTKSPKTVVHNDNVERPRMMTRSKTPTRFDDSFLKTENASDIRMENIIDIDKSPDVGKKGDNKENDKSLAANNGDDEFEEIDNDGLTVADITIVSDDYLRALIKYAEHVRENAELYKGKAVEKRVQPNNEVVIAKLPDQIYIGIKYNRDTLLTSKNEYERAQYDESEAKTILSLKDLLEQGACKPEEDPNLFVSNLDITDLEIQETIEKVLIVRKTSKLEWLRMEANLIELDAKIKGCLGLDKADPKIALDHLETMLSLEIDPLMLKKHPHVVDMVKRLRRYIGNVKEWKLNDEDREKFERDAHNVRERANNVYTKFANLFNLSDDVLFWESFSQEVQEFKQQVKGMQETQVFALTAEPHSRQSFLDTIEDEEEMRLIVAKMERTTKNNKAEKENSSKVANYDANSDDGVSTETPN